jgi:hypothetical protein
VCATTPVSSRLAWRNTLGHAPRHMESVMLLPQRRLECIRVSISLTGHCTLHLRLALSAFTPLDVLTRLAFEMRRMGWNRIIGLFTMVFMAHLSLVSADLVCASRSGQHSAMAHNATSTTSASMDGMDSNDMRTPTRSTAASLVSPATRATDHAPCQIPSSSHCCDAMTGCALTLATTEVPRASLPAGDERVAAARALVPLSRRTAPETPPPKA